MITLFQMAAEGGGAADLNIVENLSLPEGYAMRFPVGWQVTPQNIGELILWSSSR